MVIDTLPVLEEWANDVPLLVKERAEITFKSGVRCLAYIAGRTQNGRIVYDSTAIHDCGKLYIQPMYIIASEISEIKTYIPLRPLIERVK